MRNWKAILWIIALLCGSVWTGHAQRTITAKQDTVISSDSAVTAVVPGETAKADSTVKAVLSAADSLPQPKVKLKEFKPDPNKALLYALVPGLGQIYNRKYWKLPLVYGAFMGCMYAITWNNKIIRTIRLPTSISWRITKRYWRQRRMDKSMRDLGRRVGRSLSETVRRARMSRMHSSGKPEAPERLFPPLQGFEHYHYGRGICDQYYRCVCGCPTVRL